jgi:hypothetical protein
VLLLLPLILFLRRKRVFLKRSLVGLLGCSIHRSRQALLVLRHCLSQLVAMEPWTLAKLATLRVMAAVVVLAFTAIMIVTGAVRAAMVLLIKAKSVILRALRAALLVKRVTMTAPDVALSQQQLLQPLPHLLRLKLKLQLQQALQP